LRSHGGFVATTVTDSSANSITKSRTPVNSGHDRLFGAITSVPEPSAWAMMLAGFGGLALLAARRRRMFLAIGLTR